MTEDRSREAAPRPRGSKRILGSVERGLLSGLVTSRILLKVMVPTMAAVWLLEEAGILGALARAASPMMALFHLPGEASLALVTGGLVNIYAAIAVAVNIPLSAKGMTVLSLMILIAHNLVVETAVQSRAGTPPAVTLTARLSASFTAGLIFARLLPEKGEPVIRAGRDFGERTFWPVVLGNLSSLFKIFLVVVGLMVAMEMMREFGFMDRITDALEIPMKTLGMDRGTSFIAAVGLLLGLAYGAGLIIHEAARSGVGRKQILATNLFLGTNHALVEDSLLFAAVGASLGWIVLGRLAFGAVFLRLALPVALRLWKPEKTGGRPGGG